MATEVSITSNENYEERAILFKRQLLMEKLYNEALEALEKNTMKTFIEDKPEFKGVIFVEKVTMLQFASSHGHVKMVKYLIHEEELKSSVTEVHGNNKCALYLACSRGHLEIVKLLWDSTPEDLKKGCLHAAIRSGNKELIRFMLDEKNYPLWEKYSGQYPVHVAARENDVAIMKMILGRKPYALELLNKDGKNALHIAMENEHLVMIEYLLEQPCWWSLAIEGNDVDGTIFLNITKSMDLNVLRRMHSIILSKSTNVYKTKLIRDLKVIMENREMEFYIAYVAPSITATAALIAGIGYVAAMSVPGGFTGKGQPALSNNKQFHHFLVLNTTTLILALAYAVVGMYSLVIQSVGSKIPIPLPTRTNSISAAAKLMIFFSQLFLVLAFFAALNAFVPATAISIIRFTAAISVPIIVFSYSLKLLVSYKDFIYILKFLIAAAQVQLRRIIPFLRGKGKKSLY